MTPRHRLVAMVAVFTAACGGSVVEGTTVTSDPATTTRSEPGLGRTEITEARSVDLPVHLQPMAERWNTDFSKTVIDLEELLVGIPVADPRDRIPPIDDPRFEPVGDIEWIDDGEPGVLIEVGDGARFYPLSVMTRHEVVNDEVGGVPVAVTYCPLCNTAIAFERKFGGQVLRLGVSGLLRNSDLVMWDLQTQTLWQQITGRAIVGEHAGKSLVPVPTAIVRWADFAADHPDGLAMGPDQGFGPIYGGNPYEFYSSGARPYSFFRGEIDDRLPPLERVVGVTLEEGAKAYPFPEIARARVVNDEIGGQPVVVFWGAEATKDALDAADISAARSIGTGIAFDPVVNGRRLTFQAVDDTRFTDEETGSTWTILGKAIQGPLEGSELTLLAHKNEFWFAWQAFYPDAPLWAKQP